MSYIMFACSVGTCSNEFGVHPGQFIRHPGWIEYSFGWVCDLHVHICDWNCGFDLDHEEMRGEDCVYDPIAAAGAHEVEGHLCGPQCYDIVDAECCEDHPDCVYDDNFHICGESCFDEGCGFYDMGAGEEARAAQGHRDLIAGTASWEDIGGPALERVVEGLTDSSDGTFEGETTLTVN